MNFSIVIPNWNGKRLLQKNLSAVLATGAGEVIVSDDGSTDGSVAFLKKDYPQVKIVAHPHLGFGGNCNLGVKTAKGEIVVLLNTDVIPQKNFLEPLKEDFQEHEVFAVSCSEPQWSWAKGKWINGFVEHEPGPKTKSPHISFWASGGSGAFRKSIWGKLGGFDEIYAPFYWEDVDLSYRAWKRGYQVFWDPRAVVSHQHQETIKCFSESYVRYISERNQLIFIWKNITDFKMILEHEFWLAWRMKNLGYWRPVLGAKMRKPRILIKKLKEWQEAKKTDREIFDQFRA